MKRLLLILPILCLCGCAAGPQQRTAAAYYDAAKHYRQTEITVSELRKQIPHIDDSLYSIE